MSDDQVTRLRDARKWFNRGQCCGQVDSAGICAAPACIFGEALKEFSRATDRIEVQAAEIAALQKRVAELEGALGDLLRCTEKHVFGDECKAQRDKARAALTGGKDG